MHSCTCNIKVCCRVKPTGTAGEHKTNTVQFKTNAASIIDTAKGTAYNFDHVFGPNVDQPELFQRVGKSLVHDILEGYNGTILAYGQTGSGKTFTIIGDAEHSRLDGIIPRSLEYLFERIINSPENLEFTVKICFLEIYMEQVRDLLNPSEQGQNLAIQQEAQGTAAWPRGLSSFYVVSAREALRLLKRGNEARTRDSLTNHQKQSKLTFVDLAGSERIAKSGATGKTLEEAKRINKSLSSLGNVINALTGENSKGNAYIPYRDSKLTRILQDALGGNSKTFLIVTIAPTLADYDESVSTLRFGERAKTVKNQAIINVQPTEEELMRELSFARREIEELKQKNLQLQQTIQTRSPKAIHSPIQGAVTVDKNNTFECNNDAWEEESNSTKESTEIAALTEAIGAYKEKNQQLAGEISRLEELLELSQQSEQKLKVENETFAQQIDQFYQQEQLKNAQQEEKNRSLNERIAMIETELNDFHDDEYSAYLQMDEQEMKEIQRFVASTISRSNNESGSTAPYSPSFDCSLSVSTMDNEECKKLQKGLLIQAYEFDKVKTILMKDLQDRCERVIELEMQLDELQRKHVQTMQQTDKAVLQQKIDIMEKNMKNILQRQSEMHQQNLDYSDTVEALELKLNAKNDQVAALEVIINELSAQVQQSQRESVHEDVQTRSPAHSKDRNSLYNNPLVRSERARIRRPMTGGSRILDYYDETENPDDDGCY